MVKKRQDEKYSRQTQSRANKKLFGRTRVKIRPQKFAVYVDISGSMSTYWKYFDSFVSQMDAQDVSYKGMFNTRLYDYDPQAFGGGTSMKEVAKHAKDNGYTPIVFTDGEYEAVDMPKDTIYVLIDDYWQGRDYGKNVYKLHKTKHGLK